MSEEEIVKMANEARKAYYREWRSKNREKIRQHNLNYWAKKAAALAAEQKGEAEDDKNED